MQKIIVAMRGRYKSGGGTSQQLEPQLSGLCNTLTSVQKDNLLLEIVEEDDEQPNYPIRKSQGRNHNYEKPKRRQSF